MGAPVTWFEVTSSQPEELFTFYKNVFGWNVEEVEDGYGIVDSDSSSGIAGGIGHAQGPHQVTFYIEVDDLKRFLKKVEQKGGKTVVPIVETPMVTFAQFADPHGNVIGLVKSA
jgi:predicted enzyme related to lactoylglutathione lyase